MSKMIIIG